MTLRQKQKFNKRLIVVSNRLPIVIDKEDDQWRIQPGSGGLITALNPILKENKSLWIGWTGAGGETPIQELLDKYGSEQGYKLVGIPLSQQEIERYYWGFSNGPYGLFSMIFSAIASLT